jgi:hypothetical protein
MASPERYWDIETQPADESFTAIAPAPGICPDNGIGDAN